MKYLTTHTQIHMRKNEKKKATIYLQIVSATCQLTHYLNKAANSISIVTQLRDSNLPFVSEDKDHAPLLCSLCRPSEYTFVDLQE